MGARCKFPNLLWMLLPRAQWKWKLCLECKGFFLLLLFNSHTHKNLVNLSSYMLKLNPKNKAFLRISVLYFYFKFNSAASELKWPRHTFKHFLIRPPSTRKKFRWYLFSSFWSKACATRLKIHEILSGCSLMLFIKGYLIPQPQNHCWVNSAIQYYLQPRSPMTDVWYLMSLYHKAQILHLTFCVPSDRPHKM